MKQPRRPVRAAAAPPARARWHAAVLLAAGVVVYSNSLSGPFIFDDRATILENQHIRDLGDPGRLLSAPTETPVAGRPIVNVTYAINYAIGEFDVTGYHAVNIAIHLLCGLLFFTIARRTLQPLWPAGAGPTAADAAFGAALLWIVHPLNTEAVNYLTQRTESLMALFYLITLYAGVRALESRRAARWAIGAVLVSALGMACKESMVTAPLMVAMYDRVFVFDSFAGAIRARWRLYVGLAATWIVLAILLATSPRTLSAGFTAPDAAPWTYLLNQAVILTHYLELAFWPRALAIYYGWPLPVTLADVWPQMLFIAGLLAATVVALVRRPKLGFLGFWFFVTLAPTSSIVPIATEVGAERRMYLPLMAVVLLVAIGAAWLFGSVMASADAKRKHRARGWMLAATAVAAVLLGAGTLARNREYRSSLMLAETTLARWPTPAAHTVLGTELAAAGFMDRAEAHLRTAVASHPPARYYLGTVLAAQDRGDEALAVLQDYVKGQIPDLDQVLLARAVMGDLLMRRGRFREASEQYRLILAGAPQDNEARRQLAGALVRLQEYDEAVSLYRTVLAERPDDFVSLGGLGVALAARGRFDEAIEAFRRAVAVNPRNSHAHQNLARALLGRGSIDEAAKEIQQALALAPDDPSARELQARIRAARK